MSRRALVVGINQYENFDPLDHAEDDAAELAELLRFHGDAEASANFDVEPPLLGRITRARLRSEVRAFFKDSKGLDIVFYFAGHGAISDAGGYLTTSDAETNDDGILMQELMGWAHGCDATSVLILLDCCHAGAAGDLGPGSRGEQQALLRENQTILAASLADQAAEESSREGGLFTAALKDALGGAAADILGNVTLAAAASFVERRFSLWSQRPVSKSYMTRPLVLRRTAPQLSRAELHRIVEFFPTPDHEFRMEPAHDPERDVAGVARTPEDPAKVAIGRLFKRYRDAHLVLASVPGEDLYYVAQRSHAVKLSIFGREYWRMVRDGRA